MRHIRVHSKHQHPDEPVDLYSELDDERFEVRKVEVFRDSRRGYAKRARVEFEAAWARRLGDYSRPTTSVVAKLLLEIMAQTRSIRVRAAAAELVVVDVDFNRWFVARKRDASEELLIRALEVTEELITTLMAVWADQRGATDDMVLFEALASARPTFLSAMH